MSDWDALQYLKFKKERTLPSLDLVKLLEIDNPKRILDIGCGPGNSTNVLRERYKDAYILGIDSSQEMIDKAKDTYKDIDFRLFDCSSDLQELGTFDIVFSNACLQWVPNHYQVFPNMFKILNKGGVLGVQIPFNFNEGVHQIIDGMINLDKWKNIIKTKRIFNQVNEIEYYNILSELTSDFTIKKITYYHDLPNHEAIVEWYKGTGLRPYLAQLSDNDKEEFLKELLIELKKSYPLEANSHVLFPFPRLFLKGVKE